MIDAYKRYQKGLTLKHLFPQQDKSLCACGCGQELKGRRSRWASDNCNSKALTYFFIIKGDVGVIRSELFNLQKGFCQKCGQYDDDWQADHILPVCKGGGGCDLTNFQTLCTDCHKAKTLSDII